MPKVKSLFFILITISLITIFSTNVFGIGVSPASVRLDYNNGIQTNINYMVRNNNNIDIVAVITIGGDLAKYFTLSRNNISLTPGFSPVWQGGRMPEPFQRLPVSSFTYFHSFGFVSPRFAGGLREAIAEMLRCGNFHNEFPLTLTLSPEERG